VNLKFVSQVRVKGEHPSLFPSFPAKRAANTAFPRGPGRPDFLGNSTSSTDPDPTRLAKEAFFL